jgi:diguanylate cyclase (GGDEF)-like protein
MRVHAQPRLPALTGLPRRVRPRLPALTGSLGRSARLGVNAAGGALAVMVVAVALADVGAFGDGGFKELINTWVFNAAELTAALMVLARALLVHRERGAWLTLAVGMLFYSAGEIYYGLVLEPMSNPPSPSPSDAGYLMFYPAAYAMVVLLVRTHVRRFPASVWLDGAIGGLSVAAVGGAFVLDPVIRTTHGSFASVAVNLAYPLADLLLLAFVVGVFALTGWRPGRTWALIGAGFALLGAADGIYLFRVAEGAYVAGTPLDAVWPAGLLLLALASWCRPRPRHEIRFEGSAVMLAPSLFALPALFLLIRASYVEQGTITESLATGALLVAVVRFALTYRDVRRLSDVRERQARTDDLTGLANRRHFYEQLGDAVEGCRARNASFALIMVDFDHFKELNDLLGHHVGDLVLALVGPRMQSVLRGGAVARIGGDEFAVILREAPAVEAIAQRLHDALAKPFELEGASVSINASLGIAVFPRDAETMDRLMQCADVAMYQAKELHAPYTLYTRSADQHSRARLELMADLKNALARRELEVYFQPQVDLRTLEPRAAEALVRWRHPEHGLLAPHSFIGLAEQGGLMRELTAFVLEQSLAQQRLWRESGHELAIAVNVSATNLVDGAFVAQLRELLARARVPPHRLQLEITESVLLAEGPRVHAVLESIAALGVKLSLDDFGTGYSPLAYLRDLPVAEVKVDRSFVATMMDSPEARTIVEAIIVLSARLGLGAVAEGIETSEQLEVLRDLGCPLGQGYLFSAPLAAGDFSAWLEQRERAPLPRAAAVVR